jgi:hypothetical protein
MNLYKYGYVRFSLFSFLRENWSFFFLKLCSVTNIPTQLLWPDEKQRLLEKEINIRNLRKYIFKIIIMYWKTFENRKMDSWTLSVGLKGCPEMPVRNFAFDSWILRMGPISCPEMPVRNFAFDSWILRMGPISCPEMPVRNFALDSGTLRMGPMRCPETFVRNCNTLCVITQKNSVLSYFAAKALNHALRTCSQ